jgi:hypothetical protein
MAKRVMEFANSVEIDRSAEEIFDVISDLPGLFAKLRKKAPLDVERTVGDGAPAIGDVWRISSKTRLGRRSGVIEMTEFSGPTTMAFRSTGRGFAVDTVITLTPQGPTRCSVTAQNELFAMTIAARMLSPAIRLWRGRVEKRLGKGLRRLRKRLER